MSGLFINVWNRKAATTDGILLSTKGGLPHLTLGYTGKLLSKAELVKRAVALFQEVVETSIVIDRVEVNTFQIGCGDNKTRDRHDVLLLVADEDCKRVEGLRDKYFGDVQIKRHNPHVSHMVDVGSRAKAEEIASKLESMLPITVTLQSVAID